MENASQALMIAAGILIGILILSLGVYLVYVFGGYVSNAKNEIAQNELAQFNDQFFKYDKRDDLTMQDIITVKNNALENNLTHSEYQRIPNFANGKNNFVDVYIGGTWILEKKDEDLLKQELESPQGRTQYTCTVQISQYTGRVYRIFFNKT